MAVTEYIIHKQAGNKDGTLSIFFDRLVAQWDDGTTDVLRISAIGSVEIDGDDHTFYVANEEHTWEVFAPEAHIEIRKRLFPETIIVEP